MKRPNFFIIGAPRCGTTSLYMWLQGHPNIYMSSVKEPHFYSIDLRPSPFTRKEYERLWEGAMDSHIAVGEVSTSYLLSQVAVPKIEREYSGARYIVLVRNPVDMAYSLYNHHLYNGREHTRDFGTAWRLSSKRWEGRLAYKSPDPKFLDYQQWCMLGEQLDRLFKIIERDRVLILVLDDIKENPRVEYLKVLNFLGVPDDGRTEFPVYNPAKRWRWPALRKAMEMIWATDLFVKNTLGIPLLRRFRILSVLNVLNVLNTRYQSPPPISAEFRKDLMNFYKEDIEKLGLLLGRDFSYWFNR